MINERDVINKRNDLSEIFQYNNPLFECYYSYANYPSSIVVRATEHWHEDIEFLYIVDGELECMVNGQQISLSKGEGLLVNSKRIHSNNSFPGKSCTFYCAITHPSLLFCNTYVEKTFIRPMIGPNSFDYIKLTKDDWTSEIMETMIPLFENTDPKNIELAIVAAMFKNFYIISKHCDMQTQIPRSDTIKVETFRSMITFIQENYKEKISLEDIAESGNVGKTLCAKLFKKYSSKTPGEYLIHYRIQKSVELLTDTDMSITEISYETGFTSSSHFTKTFHEVMGCTPLKYRNL